MTVVVEVTWTGFDNLNNLRQACHAISGSVQDHARRDCDGDSKLSSCWSPPAQARGGLRGTETRGPAAGRVRAWRWC